jgi:hypothetical protein
MPPAKKKKKKSGSKGYGGVGRAWSSVPGDTGGTRSPEKKKAKKMSGGAQPGWEKQAKRFEEETMAEFAKDYAKWKKDRKKK